MAKRKMFNIKLARRGEMRMAKMAAAAAAASKETWLKRLVASASAHQAAAAAWLVCCRGSAEREKAAASQIGEKPRAAKSAVYAAPSTVAHRPGVGGYNANGVA